MQSDEEIGKVAAAVPVLISRAIEMFMVRLLRDAEQQIVQRNARTLTPQHIKQAINSHQCMSFLAHLVQDIPDNYQQSQQDDVDGGEEVKPAKKRKKNNSIPTSFLAPPVAPYTQKSTSSHSVIKEPQQH